MSGGRVRSQEDWAATEDWTFTGGLGGHRGPLGVPIGGTDTGPDTMVDVMVDVPRKMGLSSAKHNGQPQSRMAYIGDEARAVKPARFG